MIIYAPAEAPVASILLPDPILSNGRGQVISSNLRTTRNGGQYTYVRKGTDKTLTYEFEDVGRGKVVELQEFLKLYQGNKFLVNDHADRNWSVTLKNESLNDVMEKKATPVIESGSFTLEFTGRQL